MSATLSIRNWPDAPHIREVVIDCEHAETILLAMHPRRVGLTDHDAVVMALAKHAAERPDCRCIDGLCRRYGMEWS